MAGGVRSAGASRKAVVVGGGIGGLTTALELRRSGWEPLVLERRETLAEVNTGFSLWGFAIARLRALGLGEGLDRIGQPIERLVHRSWRGGQLTDVSLAQLNKQLEAPAYELHRAGLQQLLAEALGPDAIRFGQGCVGVVDEGRPAALLERGEWVAGDLLVGADGVGSAVRRHVVGDVRLARGDVAIWRGVADVGTEVVPPGWHIRIMGPASLFGVGRLDERQVRWYAAAPAPEDHSRAGPRRADQVEQRFGDWPTPAGEVIAATEPHSVLLNDAPRARPLRRWRRGAVVLVGDAAHPTLPSLATGGGLAIEDAGALAECLPAEADLPIALGEYERRRRPVASRIQRESLLFAGVLALCHRPLVAARELLFGRLQRVQPLVIEHLSRSDGRWLRSDRRPFHRRTARRPAAAPPVTNDRP